MENLPKITDFKCGDILIPNKFDGTFDSYFLAHDMLENQKYVTIKSIVPHEIIEWPKTNKCGFTIVLEEFPKYPFDPRYFGKNMGQCPVVKMFYHSQQLKQDDAAE